MEIRDKKKDRQPSSLVSGSPKKGGAGGKGAWGVGGLDDLNAVPVKDDKDPNYDSEEEEVPVVMNKVEKNAPMDNLLREFLVSGDIEETIKSLKELKVTDVHDQFVKKSIVMAMDKQAYERELVSKLLSAIYNVAVTPDKITEGFQTVLDTLDDIVLDTPDAVEIVSKFLARAVLDEIVPPAFLKTATVKNDLAGQVIHDADFLLNQPFRSERLSHVWGPGDLHSVKKLKGEINTIIEEYLVTGDEKEADHSIRELNCHFFHPQLVRQALDLALIKNPEQQKKILTLLAFLSKEDLISKGHMAEGFRVCVAQVEDTKLDVPAAPALIESFVKTAKSEGWLEDFA